MSIMEKALLGGFIACLATCIGSLFFPWADRVALLRRIRSSTDFVLGVMLSAVAFSLIGPQLIAAQSNWEAAGSVAAGSLIGMIFIAWTKRWAETLQPDAARVSQLVLAFALIFHNLPEGMAAGASLAGFETYRAIPILASISAQNLVEGLLLTICLRGLGANTLVAVLGGFGSGIIEFAGSILAGYALQTTESALPFLLSAAGGAMLWSVLVEYEESLQSQRRFRLADFSFGLAVVPLLNIITSF